MKGNDRMLAIWRPQYVLQRHRWELVKERDNVCYRWQDWKNGRTQASRCLDNRVTISRCWVCCCRIYRFPCWNLILFLIIISYDVSILPFWNGNFMQCLYVMKAYKLFLYFWSSQLRGYIFFQVRVLVFIMSILLKKYTEFEIGMHVFLHYKMAIRLWGPGVKGYDKNNVFGSQGDKGWNCNAQCHLGDNPLASLVREVAPRLVCEGFCWLN